MQNQFVKKNKTFREQRKKRSHNGGLFLDSNHYSVASTVLHSNANDWSILGGE